MGERSKPIVIVAIENHRGISSDSALAEELLQVFLAYEVASDTGSFRSDCQPQSTAPAM